MMEVTPTGPAPPGLALVSRYAADRLLRLHAALARQRDAESMLHGAALAAVRALMPRAIFSLYLDCIEAGVGEEARRLLGRPADPPVASTASTGQTSHPDTAPAGIA